MQDIPRHWGARGIIIIIIIIVIICSNCSDYSDIQTDESQYWIIPA